MLIASNINYLLAIGTASIAIIFYTENERLKCDCREIGMPVPDRQFTDVLIRTYLAGGQRIRAAIIQTETKRTTINLCQIGTQEL